MFKVLLETEAKRQRRAGGATLSVAAHLAIVGAVAAGTAHGRPVQPPEKPQQVNVVVPVQRAKVVTESREPQRAATTAPPDMVIRRIDAPRFTPRELPPIQPSTGAPIDSIVVGGAAGPGTSLGAAAGGIFDEPRGGVSEWNTSELLMHVLAPAKPRYPESLRSAGIEGRVLVEFTVDTTGRVDASSVKIINSTHDLFTRAVRDALGNFRFRPAEIGGRRIEARAQMPFEFAITR